MTEPPFEEVSSIKPSAHSGTTRINEIYGIPSLDGPGGQRIVPGYHHEARVHNDIRVLSGCM